MFKKFSKWNFITKFIFEGLKGTTIDRFSNKCLMSNQYKVRGQLVVIGYSGDPLKSVTVPHSILPWPYTITFLRTTFWKWNCRIQNKKRIIRRVHFIQIGKCECAPSQQQFWMRRRWPFDSGSDVCVVVVVFAVCLLWECIYLDRTELNLIAISGTRL